jgi:hypothetical protein
MASATFGDFRHKDMGDEGKISGADPLSFVKDLLAGGGESSAARASPWRARLSDGCEVGRAKPLTETRAQWLAVSPRPSWLLSSE